MTSILVVGSGRVGRRIALNLQDIGGHEVALADRVRPTHVPESTKFVALDAANSAQLAETLKGFQIVISACPHYLSPGIARAAKESGAHYFDLTESVSATNAIRALAEGADTAFMPQCGFAPGFIGVVAAHLVRQLDRTETLALRAGCVPQVRENRLGYGNMWSTEGVVHEYIHPCEAMENGEIVRLRALEGLERVVCDGMEWEAFNTSGCVGSLCETFKDVANINYKTLRYPGHCELMRFLIDDMGFREREADLVALLNRSLPVVHQDLMVLIVSAEGLLEGRRVRKTFSRRYKGTGKEGETAIEVMTAAGICATVDLFIRGKLPQRGFVRQEEARFEEYILSPFAAPLVVSAI